MTDTTVLTPDDQKARAFLSVLEQIGLPQNCTAATIYFRVGEPVEIEATFYPPRAQPVAPESFDLVTARYRLIAAPDA